MTKMEKLQETLLGMRLPDGYNTDALHDAVRELKRLDADAKQLRGFACDVMQCWPEGDGPDGGDLQSMAEKHGLLRPETRHEPCDDESNRCYCLEYVGREDFPLTCYRKTDLLTYNANWMS